MAAVGLVAFLFASASLALVVGSGAGRFTDPDDPTMLWVGFAFFGVFCVLALVVKALNDGPVLTGMAGQITIAVIALIGLAVGIGLDISN